MLHQVTSLLIASKYIEVDDNLVKIEDLQDYCKLIQAEHPKHKLVPLKEAILMCEGEMLVHF